MSAQAGWYPDPGGGQGLYRYWDGGAWSAATSPNPAAPPPAVSLGNAVPPAVQSTGGQPYGQQTYGEQSQTSPLGASSGQGAGYGQAYANYQTATQKRKSPVGWWLGAAALLLVIIVVAVFVIRGITGGSVTGNPQGGQGSENSCPESQSSSPSALPAPTDGRIHGGPISYPTLGKPWTAATSDPRVPFGSDVASQTFLVEKNYDGKGDSWVASVLVGELQAGDGFYTPQQGSQVVVKCIIGTFYGDAEVQSDVKVNKAEKIDGHDGWVVESQLSFDIPNLKTKGELLIVAIVATGSTAGLFYASIPDTTPQLVEPARNALKNLKVDS